jgi:hypothetical protein
MNVELAVTLHVYVQRVQLSQCELVLPAAAACTHCTALMHVSLGLKVPFHALSLTVMK